MGWGERAGRAIDGWWRVVVSAILVIGGGISISTVGGAPTNLREWLFTSIGAAASLGGTIWTSIVSIQTHRQRSQIVTASRNLEARFGLHGPTAKRVLKDIAGSVLEESGKYYNYRLSLFIPNADGTFQLVSRFSDNPTYETAGHRDRYPPTEGLVSKVWHDGGTLVKGKLPRDRREWEAEMVSQFNISDEAARKLRMQSRSYMATLLRSDSGVSSVRTAVLVVESTKSEGIVPKHAGKLERCVFLDHARSICEDLIAVSSALSAVE